MSNALLQAKVLKHMLHVVFVLLPAWKGNGIIMGEGNPLKPSIPGRPVGSSRELLLSELCPAGDAPGDGCVLLVGVVALLIGVLRPSEPAPGEWLPFCKLPGAGDN